MKNTNLFINSVLFALLLVCSCKKDKVDTLEITSDKTRIWNTGKDTVRFTVKDGDGNDVSDKVTLLPDWTDGANHLNGCRFSSTKAGSYMFFASYLGVNSNSIDIDVLAVSVPDEKSSYTKKLLIEDFTGSWCGYCPRVARAIDLMVTDNQKIIPVAVHYSDEMATTYASNLASSYGITGYPTGLLDCTSKWDEKQASIDYLLTKVSYLGLGISSVLSGTTANVTVKVGFAKDISGLKLVVYMTQDKIIASQANYYDNTSSSYWYQKGNPITNFEHNFVFRKSLTDVFGDAIPVSESVKGNVYSKSYSLNVSSYATQNCSIVAFVVSDGSSVSKGAVNVQKVKLDGVQDFD